MSRPLWSTGYDDSDARREAALAGAAAPDVPALPRLLAGAMGHPTVTLAEHVAVHGLAALDRKAHGADWFRAVGDPAAPGTMLVTITGAVVRSGVREVATGASLSALLDAAGVDGAPSRDVAGPAAARPHDVARPAAAPPRDVVELLPERIVADDWGYPMIDGYPLPPELVAHARRAAADCPALALKLARADG